MGPEDEHEGSHEASSMLLGILNLSILVLSSFFLIKLIILYKSGDNKEVEEEIRTIQSQKSFSYQSSLSSQYSVKETKYVVYFVIFGIICVCIASFFGVIFYFESFFTFITTLSSAMFESTHELFWNLGTIACYSLFVDRLKASFRHTSYKISEVQLITFRILIVVYLLCVLAFCICKFNSVSSAFYTQEIFPWIYVFGIETIDFFIAFWLMFMFCNKLLHVTMDVKNANTYFMDNLKAKDVILLNKITKYCTLCIIAISSTQIVNMLRIIVFLVIRARKQSDDTFNDLPIVSMHRAVMSLDMLINVLCLFLTISYSSKYYDKFCGGFQNVIKTCCEACSSSSLMKRKEDKAYQMALLGTNDN